MIEQDLHATITEIRDRGIRVEMMVKQNSVLLEQRVKVGEDHELRIRKIESTLSFVRNAWAVGVAAIAATAAAFGAWIQSRFN